MIFGNETLRVALVADAVQVTGSTADGALPAVSQQEIAGILKTLPIGWTCPASGASSTGAPVVASSDGAVAPCWDVSLPWSLLGWLITAVALSFGAPFWFDILGLAVNLRGDGSRKQQPAIPPDA